MSKQLIILEESEIESDEKNSSLIRKSKALLKTAETLDIQEQIDYQKAGDLCAEAKAILKGYETRRKEIIKESSGFISMINNLYKLWKFPLEKTEKILKGKQKIFYLAQEKLRLAEEDKLRKAREKAEEKGKPVPIAEPKIEPVKSVVSEKATTTMRDNWVFEITEPAKVPVEFLSPDPKKIQAAVNAEVRDIPGIRIFNDPIASNRGRGY